MEIAKSIVVGTDAVKAQLIVEQGFWPNRVTSEANGTSILSSLSSVGFRSIFLSLARRIWVFQETSVRSLLE